MQDLSHTGISISGALKKKSDDWSSKCMSHVQTLQQILSLLFEGLDSDDDKEDIKSSKKKIKSLLRNIETDKDDGSQLPLFNLFSNRCYSLIQLLSEKTKFPVRLPLSSVMRVLTRCLKVSYTDVTAFPSMALLASRIADLHQSCMDVLGQLILCCKKNLLPLSHPIIDLCLQTLSSANKMEYHQKSRTYASVYQTLLLWIQTCGWSSYLSSHAKMITQNLISNTQIVEDSLRITAGKQDALSDALFGKRKKGKKKRVNKGDSYAELGVANDEQTVKAMSSDEVDFLLNSLTVACFAVENLPFSSSQNLIQHITDTAAAVQKKQTNIPKPYHIVAIRKMLYRAVAACTLVSLDHSCHRNDAIFHFQLTNSALHLLIAGDCKEVHEVKLVCDEALKKMESYGNIKGPIVRKVLPNDNNDMEDITDLTRERDRLADDLESLRTRLLDSEVENDQQSRLITSLKKELNNLRVQRVYQEVDSYSHNDKSHGKDSSDNDEKMAEADDDHDSDNEVAAHGIAKDDGREKDENADIDEENHFPISSTSSSHASVRRNNGIKEHERRMTDSGKESINSPKKRAGGAESKSADVSVKRLKQDDQEEDSAGIQDMLLDFVDAPPDNV